MIRIDCTKHHLGLVAIASVAALILLSALRILKDVIPGRAGFSQASVGVDDLAASEEQSSDYQDIGH